MPDLARASPQRELERLIRLYLKAETDIINEIGRLRSQGLVDYHAVKGINQSMSAFVDALHREGVTTFTDIMML